jgi:hypothetical protein
MTSLLEIIEYQHGRVFCPAIVARPGIASSRQCINVEHGTPIAHFQDGGFVFPRIVWSVDAHNVTTILKDDGVGAVPLPPV